MAFDPELDQTLDSKELNFGNTRIIVSIKQYNEGMKKIQIGRENNRNDEWAFSKLGRLTKEEAQGVAKALEELSSQLD